MFISNIIFKHCPPNLGIHFGESAMLLTGVLISPQSLYSCFVGFVLNHLEAIRNELLKVFSVMFSVRIRCRIK
jgi:hypothetical protein